MFIKIMSFLQKSLLSWWQPIRMGLLAPTGSLFLDKLCIHQGDRKIKLKAINNVDHFLAHSTSMLLLWDTTYFERLWCVFEVAIFLALNRKSPSITFVPIQLFCAELVMMIVQWIVLFIVVILVSTNILQNMMGVIIEWGFPSILVSASTVYTPLFPICMPLVFALRSYMRAIREMTSQITDFRVAKAHCFDEFKTH